MGGQVPLIIPGAYKINNEKALKLLLTKSSICMHTFIHIHMPLEKMTGLVRVGYDGACLFVVVGFVLLF